MIPTHFGMPPYSEYPAIYKRMKELAAKLVYLEGYIENLEIIAHRAATNDAYDEENEYLWELVRAVQKGPNAVA